MLNYSVAELRINKKLQLYDKNTYSCTTIEISKNALEGQKHNHLIFSIFTSHLIFSIFINK